MNIVSDAGVGTSKRRNSAMDVVTSSLGDLDIKVAIGKNNKKEKKKKTKKKKTTMTRMLVWDPQHSWERKMQATRVLPTNLLNALIVPYAGEYVRINRREFRLVTIKGQNGVQFFCDGGTAACPHLSETRQRFACHKSNRLRVTITRQFMHLHCMDFECVGDYHIQLLAEHAAQVNTLVGIFGG